LVAWKPFVKTRGVLEILKISSSMMVSYTDTGVAFYSGVAYGLEEISPHIVNFLGASSWKR
jgi:hypothetical protein